jgi:hypothetical protein
LKQKQLWLFKSARQFNRSAPTVDKLRDFLIECSRLFEAAGRALHHRLIADCVGFTPSQPSAEAEQEIVLNLSVHDVLETGLNVLVLADASPGQPNTLPVYARRRLERQGNDELMFFLPLAKVLASPGSAAAPATLPPGDRLEKCIAEFLGSLDPEIGKNDLAITLREGHGAVLFDGLDEAVPANPWLVEAINQFNRRYPRLQCIVSSRNHQKNFRFFTITLRS